MQGDVDWWSNHSIVPSPSVYPGRAMNWHEGHSNRCHVDCCLVMFGAALTCSEVNWASKIPSGGWYSSLHELWAGLFSENNMLHVHADALWEYLHDHANNTLGRNQGIVPSTGDPGDCNDVASFLCNQTDLNLHLPHLGSYDACETKSCLCGNLNHEHNDSSIPAVYRPTMIRVINNELSTSEDILRLLTERSENGECVRLHDERNRCTQCGEVKL